ncbi:hypothetical protein [Streptomyces fumanus]|uniref:Uncharacterized protein n=1 Tax=Streptomyces fumanus TaxID=67302 RepID=A0A919A3U3_9ACTN|nr:hypothetical protein [Streptomyces fumanus]GHE85133.1 hypothetical protein GCM10018772_05370 [Streptomyces fumanus]
MAELAYPHYVLQADGPRETGINVTIVVSDGVGGPLPGKTVDGVVEHLRDYLLGEDGDVTVQLVHNQIQSTPL